MPNFDISTKIFLSGVSLIAVGCVSATYVHVASRFITWVVGLIP